MIINVTLKRFREDVATVASAAPSKPSQRSLACIYIDARGPEIHMRATDLVTFVRVTTDGEITKPGACLVEAKALLDRVRVLPEASPVVTLEIKGSKLRLLCGNAKHELETLPTEEYPVWPRAFELSTSMPAAEIARAIRTVEHAADDDETRPWLSAIRMAADGATLTLATTDGHRLAKTETPCKAAFDALVPIKAKGALLRALEAADADVSIGTDGAQYFGVRTAAHDIVVRMHDWKTFPPYSNVIPAPSRNRATVCREIALSALRNVEVAARERLKDAGMAAHVSIRMRDGNLVLQGQSKDGATASDEIDCDYAGDEMVFGVNALYMIATLNAMTSDDVVVDLAEPLAAMRIDPVAESRDVFIIMPVRI